MGYICGGGHTGFVHAAVVAALSAAAGIYWSYSWHSETMVEEEED